MDGAKKINWFGWKPTKLRRLSLKRPLSKIELSLIESEIERIETIFDEGYLSDEPEREDELVARLDRLIKYIEKSLEFTERYHKIA